MSVYCDTSLLIAALVGEEGASERVHAWLAEAEARSLVISDWSITEFSSAVSMKWRSGKVTPEQRSDVLATWGMLRKTTLTTVAVGSDHFTTAAIYAERADLGLRAGDALHLAVAGANGCSLATLDATQASAAIELGIPVETV